MTTSAIELARTQLDSRFTRLREMRPALHAPRGGWLRALRTSLGMRLQDVGARLGVSAQAVAQMESREAAGTITLNGLREAAAAMDAEVFVVVVPARGSAESLDQRAESVARVLAAQVHHSMRMEDQATGDAEWRARVADIKATLLRTPSLLWTMPDGAERGSDGRSHTG